MHDHDHANRPTNRARRRHQLLGIGLAMTMAFVAAACGGDDDDGATATTAAPASGDATTTSGGEAPADVIEFNYTGVASGVSGVLPFVISKYDLDAPFGVNWNVNNLETGGVILRALTSGRADVSTMGAPALLQAFDQFPQIRVLAPFYWMHGALLAGSDSDVTSLQDLVDAGDKIVAPDRSSGIRSALELLTAQEGLDFGKLQVVEANPTIGLASVAHGEVEATVAWTPISNVQVATGAYKEILDIRQAWKDETGQDMLNGVLVSSQDWIDEHPEGPERIRQSIAAGIDYLRTHDEVWEDPDVMQILGITDASQVPAIKDAVLNLYITEWSDQNTDDQISILDKMIDMGIYPSVPDSDLEAIWAPASV